MTSRLPKILAASLFLAAQAASAMTPSSTDDARALAGNALPAPTQHPSAPAARAPSSTDEARAIAGGALPAAARRSVAPGKHVLSSSDEARTLGAGSAW